MNNKGKKELLEMFGRLDPENQLNILAHVRVALAAQENTRKAISRQDKHDKRRKPA